MENIRLEFYGMTYINTLDSPTIHLSLDGNGIHYSYSKMWRSFLYKNPRDWHQYENSVIIPDEVMDEFTEAAIDEILALDDIPNKTRYDDLDGSHYLISIKKGNVNKDYHANSLSILTYPLLRKLASWYDTIGIEVKMYTIDDLPEKLDV